MIDDLDLRRIIGVGHSMGGHTIVDAALQRSERFAALVLVDPTIFSPDRPGPPVGTFDFVLRRRNEWGLPEEMVERFAGRRPFDVWAPRALRDYARYGLLPAPSGDGYVLACPPEVESAVYEGRDASPEHDVLSRVKQLTLPVRVLRGGKPLAGFALGYVSEGETREHVAMTDAEGRASATLDVKGIEGTSAGTATG